MGPGNGTIQCALGMGLANVPWEKGLSNVPWEWDCQCAQRIGLTNMLCEWDYPMCPGNGTS